VPAICALFRASWLNGISGGLIITAHTSPYLFFPLSNCTYNSHIIKTKIYLRTSCAFSIRVQFSKFQTVKPGCPPSQPHTFWSIAIRRDICAALYFCSCELRWRSTECVLLPVLTRCRIFLQSWTALSYETADNLCSLQWHIIAYNNEYRECV